VDGAVAAGGGRNGEGVLPGQPADVIEIVWHADILPGPDWRPEGAGGMVGA
jgi:hypothetical protein